MTATIQNVSSATLDRDGVIRRAEAEAEPLIEEYFDIDPIEKMLVSDTVKVVIPSARPGRTREAVPTISQAKEPDRQRYTELLCEVLNSWATKEFQVHGKAVADGRLGMGMVVLEKTPRGQAPTHLDAATKDILATLTSLQKVAGSKEGTLHLARGLKVFHKSLLYVTKPIGLRFWTCPLP